MERRIWFDIVATGKMGDYKAWFEARNKLIEKVAPGKGLPKMYEVQGRTQGMVCVISSELTAGEWKEFGAKYSADEGIRALGGTGTNKLVVDGATETFLLTEA